MDKNVKPWSTSVFIGGTGRCGTSILKKLIGDHPNITTIPPELRLHIAPGGLLDLKRSMSADWSRTRGNAAIQQFIAICHRKRSLRGIRKFVEKLARLVNFSLFRKPILGLDDSACFGTALSRELKVLKRHLITDENRSSHPESPDPGQNFYESEPYEEDDMNRLLTEFIDKLFRSVNSESRIWCEDSPPNLLHVNRLQNIFSDRKVKFIHMVRNPEDVVSSWMKDSNFWSPGDFQSVLKGVRKIAEGIDRELNAADDIEIRNQCFEELIDHPERSMEEIFHFIDVDSPEHTLLPDQEKANIGRGKQQFDQNRLNQIEEQLYWFYERYAR